MSEKVIGSVADFVETCLQLYPPFRWDEDQERTWSAIMTRELHGFSPEVLDRAFTDLMRSRKKDKSTPSPGECLAFCVEAKRWRDMEANESKLPEFRTPQGEYSTERWRLAHELKRSPLGKRAAQEGWIVSFVNFCRRNQRLPAGSEIDQCKRDSSGIEEIYGRAMRGECGPFSKEIASFAISILEKRRLWSEEALRHG